MPDVSVIVVTLQEKENIQSLSPLEKDSFDDFEVIIRDDEGISTARNEGIKRARADKIVFLDDDAIPTDGYLQAASRLLEEHEVVAGRVIHPADDVFKQFNTNIDLGDSEQYIDTIRGCNMGFRREVFEEVGYFDESFDWGHDEIELRDRILDAGYDIRYSPDMCVTHPYCTTRREYWYKMYLKGKADVRYWDRRDVARSERIRKMIHPRLYVHPPGTGNLLKTVGQVLKNVGRARGYAAKYRNSLRQ